MIFSIKVVHQVVGEVIRFLKDCSEWVCLGMISHILPCNHLLRRQQRAGGDEQTVMVINMQARAPHICKKSAYPTTVYPSKCFPTPCTGAESEKFALPKAWLNPQILYFCDNSRPSVHKFRVQKWLTTVLRGPCPTSHPGPEC